MGQFFTQETILEYFAKARNNRVLFHTCLLLGDSSTWLTNITYHLSKIFLCQNLSLQPPFFCGKCKHCIKINFNEHADIHLIERSEDKTVISIDQIRDHVKGEAYTKPWESEYKIFIIKDIDELKDEAGNSLLKLLEEPPEYCIFLLIAQNESSILTTILSRCQKFRIIPDSHDNTDVLMQEHGLTKEQSLTILKLCNQNLPVALDMLQNKWKYRLEFLQFCLEREDPLQKAEYIVRYWFNKKEDGVAKVTQEEIFSHLISLWHDVLICQYMPYKQEYLVNLDFSGQIQKLAARLNPNQVERLLEKLLNMMQHINRTNPKIFWATFMINSYLLSAEK